MPIEGEDKTAEAHALRIGKLFSNLLSLEFSIRAYFANLPGAKPVSPFGVSIYTNPVGSFVPESALTEFVYLSALIERFNAHQKDTDSPQIDTSIIDLRNALAHGLVSAPMEDSTMHLMKFGKAISGVVPVTVNEAMTDQWFKAQISKAANAIGVVYQVLPKQ
jgi:hypothetical protein